jgi:predicted Rossmann fold flavoprotein
VLGLVIKNLNSTKIWDVIVIGAGPAGMMAAGTVAAAGKSVLLLEKNPGLGKKLLITGGGRCNLTNDKPEISDLVNSYRGAPKALYSVFTQFGVSDTLEFFHSRGMPTKLEAEGRIFPASNSAESVWQVMVDFLKQTKVTVASGREVREITKDDSGIFQISTNDGTESGRACILATGGKSHPETGSTGAGFGWLKQLGHKISESNYALVPVKVAEPWVSQLAGVSLQDVKLHILLDDKRMHSSTGKVLFTHIGMSGPGILNMSSKIGELLPEGQVKIELDFLPHLDQGAVKDDIHQLLTSQSNKKIKNSLGDLIASALVPIMLELASISPDTPNHSVTKVQRQKLRELIKAFQLNVKSLLGADKAVVSSGGVELDQIDLKTMQSKLIPGLFVIGDVLNIDRPSGGYSLQLCWSTGFVAGTHA